MNSDAAVVVDGALLSAGQLSGLTRIYSGKVRDCYEVDANTLLVVATDRISAFDVVMLNGVPGKGKILSQLTDFWMKHLKEAGAGLDDHLITCDVTQMPDSCRKHAAVLSGRSMLVRKLQMLPVEAIVRGYITGSGWVDYQASGAVCGHILPASLELCEKLPEVLYTPSSKADAGDHDENITTEQARSLLGDSHAALVEAHAKRVYNLACAYAEKRGVLVADTKMEFGVALGGDGTKIILGDECLTPDCSRYWPADDYAKGRDQASFDKQYVRNYLKESNFDKKTPVVLPAEVIQATKDKYVKIFQILTGADPVL